MSAPSGVERDLTCPMHERPDSNPHVPMQAYIGVHMSAWSYNNLIQAWEPILEPWNVILKADMNTGSMVSSLPLILNADRPLSLYKAPIETMAPRYQQDERLAQFFGMYEAAAAQACTLF